MMKVLVVSKLAELKEMRRFVEEMMIELNQEFEQSEGKTMDEFSAAYQEKLFRPLLDLYVKEHELNLLKESCTEKFLLKLSQANIVI